MSQETEGMVVENVGGLILNRKKVRVMKKVDAFK